MKTLQKLLLAATLTTWIGATAFAQSNDANESRPPRGGPGDHQRPDPAAMVQNLATRYASLAAYDTNKDGQLDATEQTALTQAITDGKIELPHPPKPPGDEQGDKHGEKPDAAKMVGHLVSFYASIAAYDVNKDGQLDATEQAAVVKAMTDGSLKLGRPGFGGHRPPPPGE